MKKVKISREFIYAAAIVIQAFAVSTMTKGNLGLSHIVASSYIISQKVDFLTFGRAEYIVQGLLIVLMCIITKKVKLPYLFTAATVAVYGAILDGFNLLWGFVAANAMWQRVILFIVGMLLTALSVSLFFHTYLSPAAYDYFVREISDFRGRDITKFKLAFDFVFLVTAVALSLILFGKIVGITVGTVVMALLNGHIIRFFSSFIEKHFELYDRFPKLAKRFE